MTDLERVRDALRRIATPPYQWDSPESRDTNEVRLRGKWAKEVLPIIDAHLKEDAEWYKRWEGVAEKLRDQEAELTELREAVRAPSIEDCQDPWECCVHDPSQLIEEKS